MRVAADRRRLLAVVACGALVLAGCAGVPQHESSAPTALPEVRSSFDISGRLAVSHGNDGFSGGFRWIAEPGADRIDLTTPLGQTVATLNSDGGVVRFAAADGRTGEAGTWEDLTVQLLGWLLPVSGLRYWVQGVPKPTVALVAAADDRGRLGSLWQDGWTIDFRYRDDVAPSAPSGLRLAFQQLVVRIAVDRRE